MYVGVGALNMSNRFSVIGTRAMNQMNNAYQGVLSKGLSFAANPNTTNYFQNSLEFTVQSGSLGEGTGLPPNTPGGALGFTLKTFNKVVDFFGGDND